jgi:DNA polymerase III delta subunit
LPVKSEFYYTYGDDTDMIEKKWLPDLQQRYSEATWLRYDATIDELPVGRLVTEYCSNDLFSKGKVIVIRNADQKPGPVESLIEGISAHPVKGNALLLIASGLNKTTRLGKLVKDNFIVREFVIPEIKPFDLLDALNSKAIPRVVHQSNRLFSAGYSALALYSLLCGHFILLQQVKAREGQTTDAIARELRQHQFRIKKAQVANRYWSLEEISGALKHLSKVGSLLRTWQYDEQMLLQMCLIKLSLGGIIAI